MLPLSVQVGNQGLGFPTKNLVQVYLGLFAGKHLCMIAFSTDAGLQ